MADPKVPYTLAKYQGKLPEPRTENPVVARVRGREARGEMLTSIERFVLAQADESERLTRELHDIRKHLPFDTLQNIALIERLTRERDEALSHEGQKDARINELLEYLHFDGTSHRDWVADCQTLEQENERLRAALQAILHAPSVAWQQIPEIVRAALGSTPGENEKSE